MIISVGKSDKMLITLKKKTCLGYFRIEEIRDKDNETNLKEGGGIEMSTTVLFHIRDARSLSLEISYHHIQHL